jgi:hypothetical protein
MLKKERKEVYTQSFGRDQQKIKRNSVSFKKIIIYFF